MLNRPQTEPVACDLCGLPIDVAGYELRAKSGQTKRFCCEGCLGIFRVLNPDEEESSHRAP